MGFATCNALSRNRLLFCWYRHAACTVALPGPRRVALHNRLANPLSCKHCNSRPRVDRHHFDGGCATVDGVRIRKLQIVMLRTSGTWHSAKPFMTASISLSRSAVCLRCCSQSGAQLQRTRPIGATRPIGNLRPSLLVPAGAPFAASWRRGDCALLVSNSSLECHRTRAWPHRD